MLYKEAQLQNLSKRSIPRASGLERSMRHVMVYNNYKNYDYHSCRIITNVWYNLYIKEAYLHVPTQHNDICSLTSGAEVKEHIIFTLQLNIYTIVSECGGLT